MLSELFEMLPDGTDYSVLSVLIALILVLARFYILAHMDEYECENCDVERYVANTLIMGASIAIIGFICNILAYKHIIPPLF